MDHPDDIANSQLLTTVIDKLEFLKKLVDTDGKPKSIPTDDYLREQNYLNGITPLSLTEKHKEFYQNKEKWVKGDAEIDNPYNLSDYPTGRMMYDVARYQIQETEKELFNTLYNETHKNHDISNELNLLFNEILPKLTVLKQIQSLEHQHKTLKDYGFEYDELKLYLGSVLRQTEDAIRKYLMRGHFLQPSGVDKTFMKYLLHH